MAGDTSLYKESRKDNIASPETMDLQTASQRLALPVREPLIIEPLLFVLPEHLRS